MLCYRPKSHCWRLLHVHTSAIRKLRQTASKTGFLSPDSVCVSLSIYFLYKSRKHPMRVNDREVRLSTNAQSYHESFKVRRINNLLKILPTLSWSQKNQQPAISCLDANQDCRNFNQTQKELILMLKIKLLCSINFLNYFKPYYNIHTLGHNSTSFFSLK